MKILHINTVAGHGSTGRNATELAEELNQNGYENYIAYGQGTTDFKKSYKIGSSIENHLHNLNSRVFGKQGYFSRNGTQGLLNFMDEINPDIIHLGNLHGNYLNFKMLFAYILEKNKPVVWTLHDCWSYTGKCAHYIDVGCEKWKTQCFKCPKVHDYPSSIVLDQSKAMYKHKKRYFTMLENMNIVTVSDWLKKETEQSFLNRFPVTRIYNWINPDIFKPTISDIKNKYNIDNEKFVVLAVSGGWNESKGLNDLLELEGILEGNMQLVIVGGTKSIGFSETSTVWIPYTDSVKELAELYSCADVFLNLSKAETFGKVTAEALSCGTPSIVYNNTASPELIGEGCGYVVNNGDVNGVKYSINKIYEKGKMFYQANCIKFSREKFDYKRNVNEYIKLYEGIYERIII